MKKKVVSVDILTKVQANIEGALSQVDKLQKHLSTLKFPEGSTKNLTSSIDKIIEKVKDFEYAAKQGVNSLEDAKKLEKSWKGVLDLLNKAGVRLEELGKVKGIFPKDVADNIDKATKAMKEYKKAREAAYGAQAYKDLKAQEEAAVSNKKKAINSRESKRIAEVSSKANLEQEKESKQWKTRGKEYQELVALVDGYDDIIKAEEHYRKELIKTNKFLTKEGEVRQKGISQQDREGQEYKNAIKAAEEYAEATSHIKKRSQERETLVNSQNYQALLEDARAIKKLEDRYAKANAEVMEAEARYEAAEEAVQRNTEAVKDFVETQTKASWSELSDSLKGLGASSDDIDKVKQNLGEVNAIVQSYQTKHINDVAIAFTQAEQALEDFGKEAKVVQSQNEQTTQSLEAMNRQAEEMEGLKNSILQFFSITNAVQLFKSAVNSAMQTVKELDATMTEAAVVTEFDVSDMWDKLPIYSAQAQKLGVSINGMYQATTLYYQQGLKTNEAMALGVETMKMAKIAGMESADATKAMTAALRGFNMELNETSAARVNDVYSELAAVTAADTAQIAAAMSKTASIASAANMEFETTAALLSQIIETTQEAPETAGTALKTIIARFSEVKSLRDQGMMTGQDSEGEDIDVNKIQTALKTVGISMEGFFAGTEGLDSILLKLAEKWPELNTETQRYIATMAAGSRQQSRFIAMMSDYGRTMELVDAANESAGASQKQFEKTLDSMATKVQKLENAWNQFLMGLANNEVLKGAVDFLSALVEGLNKTIDAVSGGNGLTKSIISLVAALGGLKAGKTLLSGFVLEETQLDNGKIAKQITYDKKKVQEQYQPNGLVASFKSKGIKEAFVSTGYDRKALRQSIENKFLKTDINSKASDDLAILLDKIDYSEIETKEALEQFKALGATADEIGPKVQKVNVNLQSVGQGAMIAGSAVGLLASAFNAAGWEQGAIALEKVSTGLVVFGGAAQALVPVINGIVSKLVAGGMSAAAAWGWVLGIAAAIGIIVGIGFAVAKSIREASDEFKLEKINEQINDMTEQAEEAKSALDDIAQTREELQKLENTFAGLTKGSKEWKEALINSNQQVLELIDKYPELLDYMTRGEYGQLTISDAGWDAAIAAQQAKYTTSMNAKLGLENAASNLEAKIEIENIAEKAAKEAYKLGEKTLTYYNDKETLYSDTDSAKIANARQTSSSSYQITQSLGHLSNYQFADLIEDFAKSGNVIDAQGREYALGLYESLTETTAGFNDVWNAMSKTKDSFEKANLVVQEAEKLEFERNKIIAENNALTSKIVSGSEYSEAVTDAAAQAFENRDELIKSAEDNYSFDANKGVNNDQNTDIIEAYSKAFNMQEEQVKNAIKNGELTYQTMKEQLATKEVDTKQVEAMEALTKALEGLDEDLGDTLAGLLTKKGLGLTKGQYDTLNKADLSVYLAESFGLSNDQQKNDFATKLEYEHWDAYVKAMEDNLNAAGDAWEFALNRFGMLSNNKKLRKNLDDYAASNKLTVEQTQALSNNLAEIIKQGGDAGVVLGSFKELTAGLSGEELQNALNTLVNTDWTVQSSVDSTIAALQDLGVNIDEQLVADLYAAANTVKHFSIETLESKLKSLQDTADLVEGKSKEGSKRYTKEEYDSLLKAGLVSEKEFIRTGFDEYVYLDETNKLLSEINDKVGQVIDDGKGSLRAAETQGSRYEEAFKDNTQIAAYRNTQGQAGYISVSEFLSGVISGNINYDGAGLRELATKLGIENAESLSYEGLIEAIKTGYNDYYGDSGEKLKENREKLKQLEKEELSIALTSRAGTQDFMNDLTGENADKAVDVIKALIGSVAGLTTAEEQFLNTLGEASKGHENLVKNLVYGNYLANQSMDELNATLNDQAEGFKANDLNSEEYRAALEKVTIAAKKVFGEEVTTAFVNANRDLFGQLMVGGDVAQKAYEQIGLRAADSYAKGLGEGLTDQDIAGIHNQVEALFGAHEIGKAIDVTELANNIAKAYGIGIDKVLEYLNIAGLTVRKDGNAIFAVIEDVLGSGLSDFGRNSSANLGDPYDKFYNQLQLINEELRKREKYEREYQRLMRQQGGASGREILDNLNQQRNTLAAQEYYWKKVQEGRLDQLKDTTKDSKYNGYAAWNDTLKTIVIDNAALEKLRLSGSSEYENVSDYISKLEEYQDGYDEATDALWDIEDELYELNQQGRDEYLDLETRIKDALVAARQKEIDELQTINDTIASSNDRILSSMRDVISEQRKARDNEKTEKNLSDKRMRLAYLQADTSGANALDILKLQKEIAEEEQNYTDSLVDQKLDELQKQNDEASTQRERQIEIMRSQLQYDEKNGVFWPEVQQLLKTGISNTGEIISDEELAILLQKQDNWKGLSEMGKQDWFKELQTTAGLAWSWLNGNKETGEESAYVKGLRGSLKTATNDLLTGLKGVLDEKWPNTSSWTFKETGKTYTSRKDAEGALTSWYNQTKSEIEARMKDEPDYAAYDGKMDLHWLAIDYQNYRKMMEAALPAYATGGLNTTTGPAWLDGTKSNPEYVLNAQQTKAFLSLVDVLGGFNSNSSGSMVGDMNVDVDINIETVKEEADVDMLAEKMKKVIVDAAKFRNNNTL